MTRLSNMITAATLAIAAMTAVPAMAQGDGVVSKAIAAGQVGEQSDGYLGINGTVSKDVRAAVDAINIKRRAAYTGIASKRGVTVSDVAAAIGCKTLANRVNQGEVYKLSGGDWQKKGAASIKLPDYCAGN